MTGTEVAVRDKGEIVRLDTEQIKFLANTEFVPERIRGNLPAIFATIATGREIGIGDMAALRHIHNVNGKPGYSAEIMTARVRQEGHSITGEVGAGKASVTGKRADNGDTMTSTWTLEMADRAGLLGKDTWKKYPEAMLWARAVSQLCRMLFPDCLAGATYTAEELEESVAAPDPAADRDPADGTPFSYGWEEDGSPAPSETPTPTPASEGAPLPATADQLKKLAVLVKGKGTKANPRTPPPLQRIYATVGIGRAMSADSLALELGGYDADGGLHWSPLRDSLTKAEANNLIDRLENFEKKLAGASA